MGSCATQVILWSLISSMITILIFVLIFYLYYLRERDQLISELNNQLNTFCENLSSVTYRQEVYVPIENGVYEKDLAVALVDIAFNTSSANCTNILPLPDPSGFISQLRVEGPEPFGTNNVMFAYIFWNRKLCHVVIS